MSDASERDLALKLHAHRIIMKTLIDALVGDGIIAERSIIGSLRAAEKAAVVMNDEEVVIKEIRFFRKLYGDRDPA